MDKIIAGLKDIKSAVAAGMTTVKHVDKLNELIRLCEEKQDWLNVAMGQQVPAQYDMIPEYGHHIVIHNATINIGCDIPPGVCRDKG